MIRARVIAISGEVATGKTEVAAALARLLPDWERIHIGRLFRDYAASQGLSVARVSHLPNEVHRMFDERVKEQMRQATGLIVEGRMAGVLARDIPRALAVFLYAPMATRVERYQKREKLASDEEALQEIQYRDVRDRSKLRQVYGLQDYRDRENYHLLINTALFQPDAIAAVILRAAAQDFAPITVAPPGGFAPSSGDDRD